MGKGKCIWQYGSFEFHFDGDFLYLIYCDNFDKLDECKNIILNKLFLEQETVHTLPNIVKFLNNNKISFRIIHDIKAENVLIRILNSNVDINFKLNDDRCYKEFDDTIFILDGFGLAHEDYRQKIHIK